MKTPVLFPELRIESGAGTGPDGIYRYSLWRIWNPNLPFLGFMLLNPSTADADTNDPTVHRCVERARALGYGGIYVANLFAFRSPYPELLFQIKFDPIGPENDGFILHTMGLCQKVVCGWGKDGTYMNRDKEVMRLLAHKALYALKENADGTPAHPLYVPYAATLLPYNGGGLPQ